MNENFEVEVCKILLNQWSNCLEEKYVSMLIKLSQRLEILTCIVSVSTNPFIKQSHDVHSSIKQHHVQSP